MKFCVKNRKYLHLYFLLFFFLFAVVIFSFSLIKFRQSHLPDKETLEVFIHQGMTYSEALNVLKKKGIITHSFPYKVLARLTGVDRKLMAGYYLFNYNSSIFEVFNKLNKGDVIMTSITIVEGETLKEICQKINKKYVIADNKKMDDKCIHLCHNKKFIASLDLNVPNLEGYLFPETYFFVKGSSTPAIVQTMVKELKKNLSHELLTRLHELNMNERELLTLASIIEKEAGSNEERELISAVFHNRLKIGMPLQSDPTAVYGTDKDRSQVTREDIIRYTDYNTYHFRGLPPGPIASPGIKSIRAALYPASVNYLYFVAKKDGTHHFSKTYKGHLKAIKKYLK